MPGNWPVRFLGGGRVVTPFPYPTVCMVLIIRNLLCFGGLMVCPET